MSAGRTSLHAARRRGAIAIAVLVVAAGLAGCGSSSSDGTSSAPAKAAGASAEVDLAGAKTILAPYVGHPSPFPVTEPLKELPPKGARIAFLDNGTPSIAEFWGYLQPAAKAMGVEVYRVKTGNDARSIGAAMDSVVEQRPAGVIFLGIEPRLMGKQLKALQANGTTVQAGAVLDGPEMGLEGVQAGPAFMNRMGELMAAWSLVRTEGKARDIVFYNIPELAFSAANYDGVKATLAKLCASCKLRSVDIPVTQIANAAPKVISDLQSHPDTDFATFPTEDLTLGLPAAMKTAGLEVPTIGPSPAPPLLAAIKEGKQDAAIGSQSGVLIWGLLDAWARQRAKQPLAGLEAQGMGLVNQFLTQDDVTFDPGKGWDGYPDYAERFAKLWGSR